MSFDLWAQLDPCADNGLACFVFSQLNTYMAQRLTTFERSMASMASTNNDYRQILQGIVKNTEALSLRSDFSHSLLAAHFSQLSKPLRVSHSRARQDAQVVARQDQEWKTAMRAEVVEQITNHFKNSLSSISIAQDPRAENHNNSMSLEEDQHQPEELRWFESQSSDHVPLDPLVDDGSNQVEPMSLASKTNNSLPSFIKKLERQIYRKAMETFLGYLDLRVYRSDPIEKDRRSGNGDFIEVENFILISAFSYKRALQLSIVYDRTHGLSSPTNFRLQLRRVCTANDPIMVALRREAPLNTLLLASEPTDIHPKTFCRQATAAAARFSMYASPRVRETNSGSQSPMSY